MADYRVFYKYENQNYRLYFSTLDLQTGQTLVKSALEEIKKYHDIAENDIFRLERRVRR